MKTTAAPVQASQKEIGRGGSDHLNSISRFLSGIPVGFYAACSTVGSITAYAS